MSCHGATRGEVRSSESDLNAVGVACRFGRVLDLEIIFADALELGFNVRWAIEGRVSLEESDHLLVVELRGFEHDILDTCSLLMFVVITLV